ncbi:Spermidine/spermine N(1)-acetyltransferase [Emticicia aquatica]|jgi:ribosomal protein S18 acetylase RimI-like enzyme|uniref:Spermidine/spermine N(1)-acetyltransferase n=1 Tax=Emticicia aquatica TaxID=1681835 RepID=A0ABN8EZR0_9BACT|nr:GNAT family N-acetyltransferase [Emticicia aquatica]CAH0996866.1 Spermidine/spermine N(1)-acetyltransferase [Emticicia aquatica]
MNYQFRLANIEDLADLRQLSEKTFRDTYTVFNTPENMELHVAKNFSLESIKNDLQKNENQYFVIELENEIIAFAKLVKGHSTDGLTEKEVVEIERFYVDKAFHGQQLGKKLMDYCVQWSIENQFKTIWLGVWENNTNAMSFYQKMGFEFLDKHTFVLGTEVQTDFTMKKSLK